MAWRLILKNDNKLLKIQLKLPNMLAFLKEINLLHSDKSLILYQALKDEVAKDVPSPCDSISTHIQKICSKLTSIFYSHELISTNLLI